MEEGKGQTDDGIYSFFIERVRQRVNVVLCMSPVGASFRDRIRMYPAIVNNTNIDLFAEWPDKALHEVAIKFLADVDLGESTNEMEVGRDIFICGNQFSEVVSVRIDWRWSFVEHMDQFKKVHFE